MKIEITEAQLIAIIDLAEDINAMIGCADEDGADKRWARQIRMVNRMLENNGLSKHKVTV